MGGEDCDVIVVESSSRVENVDQAVWVDLLDNIRMSSRKGWELEAAVHISGSGTNKRKEIGVEGKSIVVVVQIEQDTR